jgi:hypothetical protein
MYLLMTIPAQGLEVVHGVVELISINVVDHLPRSHPASRRALFTQRGLADLGLADLLPFRVIPTFESRLPVVIPTLADLVLVLITKP